LLGTLQFPSNQSTTGFTGFLLTGASAATLNILAGDLNTGAKFRIVVTPEDSTVAATYRGDSIFNGVYEAPQLSFNYSPAGAATQPSIVGTQVGDGSAQRSSVKSFSITFNAPVNFTSSSFSLFQASVNTVNGISSVTDYTNDVSSGVTFSSTDNITWTFTGVSGGLLDRNGAGGTGFLADGVYRLVLHGAAVTDQATGTAALASGDQIASFANSESTNAGSAQAFHVLYGDINGDGTVTNGDLNKFRQSFTPLGGTYNAAFDFNNDGFINNSDLNTFRKRFLLGFTY
jgi:hypothetical protein